TGAVIAQAEVAAAEERLDLDGPGALVGDAGVVEPGARGAGPGPGEVVEGMGHARRITRKTMVSGVARIRALCAHGFRVSPVARATRDVRGEAHARASSPGAGDMTSLRGCGPAGRRELRDFSRPWRRFCGWSRETARIC